MDIAWIVCISCFLIHSRKRARHRITQFFYIYIGLHYLHGKKVLHRDLKTANIFLMKDRNRKSPSFKVKIGDLGVAKLLETSTAFAQTVVGTPYYLSPELCSDQPYGDKSDCWALGILLYEVIYKHSSNCIFCMKPDSSYSLLFHFSVAL